MTGNHVYNQVLHSSRVRLNLVSTLVCLWTAPLVWGETGPVWSIGEPDGLSVEFAPGARDQLTYTVGQSVVSRDFAGNHNGSVGWDGKVVEKPYTIAFDLGEPPQGRYELALDLIFNTGAPRHFKVRVNDKTGIFPIRPVPMHSMWGEQGNEMLLAKQELVVPIDGTWLKPNGNQITLTPLGIGNLAYDAITFRRANSNAEKLRIEPTIFFRKRGGELVEVCEVVAPFEQRFDHGAATVSLGKRVFSESFTNTLYDFGLWIGPIEIPASTVAGLANLELTLDGKKQQATCNLRPAKQWKLFVCPKVHNDVGYTDLQPNVNELDNRNSDQVLNILRHYPFYKFNFEKIGRAHV
jgi:hypothetical protein